MTDIRIVLLEQGTALEASRMKKAIVDKVYQVMLWLR